MYKISLVRGKKENNYSSMAAKRVKPEGFCDQQRISYNSLVSWCKILR
ncbi:MAG: hypothetical protein IPP27_05355 [Bacteroidetes bacterium]|nr:hypothetical protein [Bacteroidota bacterium]